MPLRSNQSCTSSCSTDAANGLKYSRFLIKLTKSNHRTNTTYGAIEAELSSKEIKKPSLKNISDAVIAIRKSVLITLFTQGGDHKGLLVTV